MTDVQMFIMKHNVSCVGLLRSDKSIKVALFCKIVEYCCVMFAIYIHIQCILLQSSARFESEHLINFL